MTRIINVLNTEEIIYIYIYIYVKYIYIYIYIYILHFYFDRVVRLMNGNFKSKTSCKTAPTFIKMIVSLYRV